jgi:hypothetical protein
MPRVSLAIVNSITLEGESLLKIPLHFWERLGGKKGRR